MASGTFLPPGLRQPGSKISSGGTNNYVMTAVDSENIQGEENLQFDGTDLTLKDNKTVALGTGSDSKIYYDGTNTLWDLQAAGTGKLRLLIDSNNKSDNYVEIGEYSGNNVQIKGGKAGAYNLSLSSNLSTYFNVDAGGSGASSFFYFAHEGEGSDSTVIAKLSDAAVLTIGGGATLDPAVIFDCGGTDFHIGIDQGADDLVIGKGTALGTTPALEIDSDSGISLGGGARPSANYTTLVSRTYTAGGFASQFRIQGQITGAAGADMNVMSMGGNTLVEAGSGTHALAAGLALYQPTLTTTGGATTTSAATLYVAGAMTGATNNYALWVDAGYARFDAGAIIGAATSTNNLIDDASTGSGSTTLYVGNASITVSSDERLKTDIRPTAINALSLVDEFKVVDFGWDDPTDTAEYDKNYRGRYTGMIAQDTVKIAPWIINDQGGGKNCNQCMSGDECEDHGMWQVEYQHLVPTLVKAIQELNAKLEAQTAAS